MYHFYSRQELEHTAIGYANPGAGKNSDLVAMEANTAYATIERPSHAQPATGNSYRGNSLVVLGPLPPPPHDYKETPLSHTTPAESIYERTYYENEDELIGLRVKRTPVEENLQTAEEDDGNYLKLVWILMQSQLNTWGMVYFKRKEYTSEW